MQGFAFDLRQSLRAFAREPGFTALAVLALAIGVGSSTAMFSVVDAALLRPLPYTAPERLIQIISVEGTGQRVPMGAVEFFELEKRATTVEAIGAFYPHSAIVASASGPRQARVAIGDPVGELLGARLVVMLIGERPGLDVNASMSAYFGYRPTPSCTDADRSLISNIHDDGIPPAQAAGDAAALVEQILATRASGVSALLAAHANKQLTDQ